MFLVDAKKGQMSKNCEINMKNWMWFFENRQSHKANQNLKSPSN